MTLGVPTSPGVPRPRRADTLLARYNDLESVRAGSLEQHRGQIAAIFVEPIAGNMGVVPPRAGFLAGPARALRSRTASLLIFDEVISGFRAAAGGAQQVFGMRPDLTCLGKIIGGGLPVGAYGGRADLMELVAPAGPVYQAGTLSGNPLAMTAGLWSLEELSPRLYRHLAKLGAQLAAGLADAARDAGVPLQVNAFGSLVTPFFTDRPVRDYESAVTADTAAYAAILQGDAGARHLSCRRRSSRRGSCRAPTPSATSRRRSRRRGPCSRKAEAGPSAQLPVISIGAETGG